jgi:SAM-dependent methyltransferase
VSDGEISLAQVRAEIDEEARRQRESGAFSAEREQELERAFLLFAPRQGHTGALSATLRGVDASILIDPAVPITSERPAGAVVKKSIRKAIFWYASWLADQVTRCLSAIAVSLHLVEEDLERINERLALVAIDATPIIERGELSGAGAWWGARALSVLGSDDGRVLVSACGDGWLVRALVDEGVDAYGIDPRLEKIQASQLAGLDVRDDDLILHLSHVAARRLSAVVLTGTTEGLFLTQRGLLLDRLERALRPDGTLLIHALHPDSMEGDAIPAALDFVGARPLRPRTWAEVLAERGFIVTVELAEDGQDFLITAARRSAIRSS